jgi:RNA polymerase sigma-70 factor (ECF subfamily)
VTHEASTVDDASRDLRIAAAVRRIAAEGRAAWPSVALADDAIEARLAALARDDPGARIDDLHDADLYLAIALASPDSAAAVQAFEAHLLPEIDVALRRMRQPATTIDEIKQALRFELLVGDDPKISNDAGRGDLAAWLRVTATHKALKLARRGAKERALDEALIDHWPGALPGPAERHLRQTYTAALKAAIHEAFSALEVRQRNVLRQHILDELTIDDLARLYRVHRATAARWVVDARADLGRGTRKRLGAMLGLPNAELDSLLRFLDSDIELSLSSLLTTR